MSAQPDPMVVAGVSPYRQPAPISPDPPSVPPAPAPPSLDHLFDEEFVVLRPWGWKLLLATSIVATLGFAAMSLASVAAGHPGGIAALAFVIALATLFSVQLVRRPRAISVGPSGLSIVSSDGKAHFYSWHRVKRWSLWQLLACRWELDIQGGPFDGYRIWPFFVPRLYRIRKLLARAQAEAAIPRRADR